MPVVGKGLRRCAINRTLAHSPPVVDVEESDAEDIVRRLHSDPSSVAPILWVVVTRQGFNTFKKKGVLLT